MRSFPSISFDGFSKTYDLVILRFFVSSQHTPAVASDSFLLLLHLYLTLFAIPESRSCAARK
jgi:hypothetical protein